LVCGRMVWKEGGNDGGWLGWVMCHDSNLLYSVFIYAQMLLHDPPLAVQCFLSSYILRASTNMLVYMQRSHSYHDYY
jgi:hypothetical protein